MRTTLNIDDGALDVIKKYASDREISLGRAASDLVCRAAEQLPRFKTKNGWVVFDVPKGAPLLTSERVKAWQKADNEDEQRRAFSPRR